MLARKATLALLLFVAALWLPLLPPPAAASDPATDLVALPRRCIGGLPPGSGGVVCCMFGYVFLDGRPEPNAKVTITNGRNGATLETWTEQTNNSGDASYGVSLSEAPLLAQEGDELTITAERTYHKTTVKHTVRTGSQHVDVVIPRLRSDDYAGDPAIFTPGPLDRFNRPSGIAVDGLDNVYVSDTNNARIVLFTKDGEYKASWGERGVKPGTFDGVQEIIVDREGYVWTADRNNNQIQKLTTNGIPILAFGEAGTRTSNPTGGKFQSPLGIAIDSDGSVFVADTYNDRIQHFTGQGVLINQWGEPTTTGEPGKFTGPNDVAIYGDTLYVADTDNHRIEKFTKNGTFLGSWGTEGVQPGQLKYPVQVQFDSAGNVYVVENGNGRIQRFGPGGSGTPKIIGSYGSENGQFANPIALAIGHDDSLYVADTYNHRIQKLSPDGTFIWARGSRGNEPGQFNFPESIAFAPNGTFVIADSFNYRMQQFQPNNTVLRVWGTQGAALGQFDEASGVAIDPAGLIYVTDLQNNRIQKFTADGQTVLTSWGSAGTGNGQFQGPTGIAVRDDRVYVVDQGNNRIQVFTSAGVFVTAWSALGLNLALGIAVSADAAYIGDAGNQRVLKLDRTTGNLLASWIATGPGLATLAEPGWVALDALGNVYVADGGGIAANNVFCRTEKYSASGQWITELPGACGGVAIAADGRVYTTQANAQSITIRRPMTFTRPIGTVVWTGERTLPQGDPLRVLGRGGDSDTISNAATGDIAGYEWAVDGTVVNTSADTSLSTGGLAVGSHSVTFRVRDSEGEYSTPQMFQIEVRPPAPSEVKSWNFMLYLDADAAGLAQFLSADNPNGALSLIARGPTRRNVTVTALYDGPTRGDSYYLIYRPDGSSQRLPYSAVSGGSSDEANMADPQTLGNFILWARRTAPSDFTYLAIADHANALDGIAWDLTTSPAGDARLTPALLRQGLMIGTDGGAQPLSIIHLDGCLMGTVEIAYQLRAMATYLIASQNQAWSLFAYDEYRSAVEPKTEPEALTQRVVQIYADQIDLARKPYTIAAYDLRNIDTLTLSLDDLGRLLQRYVLADQANRTAVYGVRGQTQKFDSDANFVINDDDQYLDLRDLVDRLKPATSADQAVTQALAAVKLNQTALMVAERHATGKYVTNHTEYTANLDGASGLAVYFPKNAGVKTFSVYARGGLAFAAVTRWDEFLTSVLSGQSFDQTLPPPVQAAPLILDTRVLLPYAISLR